MRATAFMQRAYSHWRALTELLQKAMVDMPTQQTLGNLREVRVLYCLLVVSGHWCSCVGGGNLSSRNLHLFIVFFSIVTLDSHSSQIPLVMEEIPPYILFWRTKSTSQCLPDSKRYPLMTYCRYPMPMHNRVGLAALLVSSHRV